MKKQSFRMPFFLSAILNEIFMLFEADDLRLI